MRRFSADYLEETRRGLWEDRGALGVLDLPARERILDVGCGSGALAAVLREESPAMIVGLDADTSLLSRAAVDGRIVGDAARLPVRERAVDLAVCQALLVNLPEPARAVRELARVSSELVGAIEPDNGAVTVDSTVAAEAPLAERAREAFMTDLGIDPTLGPRVADLFREAGLREVEVRRHEQVRRTVPPYAERDLEAARRRAAATRLEETRETLLDGGLSPSGYDDLRADWRSMGRDVIEQMRAGEYERVERIPFYVTVGRV